MLVVIPARLKSTRLPHKPLVDLCGTPMIVRTYRQALQVFPAEQILVATDAQEIVDVCDAHGINTMVTRSDHLTGTDRVAEVAERTDAETYINLQGDEPLFNPADLELLRVKALEQPDKIINGYCPIGDEEDYRSRSVPKVVFGAGGKLLYMSRSTIPGGKEDVFRFGYRQVCAYAFPRKSLAIFAQVGKKTPLEEAEDIELLRFLESGVDIQMIEMSSRSIAVDTPSDVKRVEEALLKNQVG